MPILDLLSFILLIINSVLVPLIFSLAFLMFIWGMAQAFFFNAGDDGKRKEGRQLAIWGVIAFAIMISVWGLVNILVQTFGFGGQGRPPIPGFGGQGQGSYGAPSQQGTSCTMNSQCGGGQCVAGRCTGGGGGLFGL